MSAEAEDLWHVRVAPDDVAILLNRQGIPLEVIRAEQRHLEATFGPME